jgi:hypothetical protein
MDLINPVRLHDARQILPDGLHQGISLCVLHSKADISATHVTFPGTVCKLDWICWPDPQILTYK